MQKVKVRILIDVYPEDISVGDIVDAYVWEGVPYPYYVTPDSEHPEMDYLGEPVRCSGFLIYKSSEVEIVE